MIARKGSWKTGVVQSRCPPNSAGERTQITSRTGDISQDPDPWNTFFCVISFPNQAQIEYPIVQTVFQRSESICPKTGGSEAVPLVLQTNLLSRFFFACSVMNASPAQRRNSRIRNQSPVEPSVTVWARNRQQPMRCMMYLTTPMMPERLLRELLSESAAVKCNSGVHAAASRMQFYPYINSRVRLIQQILTQVLLP